MPFFSVEMSGLHETAHKAFRFRYARHAIGPALIPQPALAPLRIFGWTLAPDFAIWRIGHDAGVVKLVDAPDSKSGSERSVGSIPTARTILSG